MADVKRGELVVIGRQGTRVHPTERDRGQHDSFGFMNSTVSSEKPKNVTVREIAAAMKAARNGNGRILVVGGPAVVHTGSRDLFSWMIEEGYVTSLGGKRVPVAADTLCIHGDQPGAVAFAQALREVFAEKGIAVAAP